MLEFNRQTPRPPSVKIKLRGKLPYTGQSEKKTRAKTALKTKPIAQSKPHIASRTVQGNPKTTILQNRFLRLHEMALKKVNDIEALRRHLKAQLNDVDIALNHQMGEVQKKEMTELIDTLCNAQRDMRSVLVNNLRAGYKAITIIDGLGQTATPEQQKVLALVRLAFSDVHNTVEGMLDMQVNSFGISEFTYLRDTIKNLDDQINSSEFKQLRSSLLTDNQALSAFNKQIDSCNEMIKVFKQAAEALTKTEVKKGAAMEVDTKKDETIIDILKQDFNEYIKDAIETIETVKKENIESAKFWGALSALIALAGLAIIVTTIALALTIYFGGTLGAVFIILGSIFGVVTFAGGVTGGAMSLGMATENDAVRPARQLQQSLNVLQKLSHPKSD